MDVLKHPLYTSLSLLVFDNQFFWLGMELDKWDAIDGKGATAIKLRRHCSKTLFNHIRLAIRQSQADAVLNFYQNPLILNYILV